MSLIDSTYFVGDLNIPNTDKDYVLERLQYFIEKMERQLLQDILGYELYKPLVAAFDQAEDDSSYTYETRLGNILNGTEYTGQDSRLHKWKGLVYVTESEVKGSLIANYVYWHWLKDQTTQTTGLGESATQAQNSTLTSPTIKMVKVWNEFAYQVQELFYFLQSNQLSYPEWTSFYKMAAARIFAPANQFGI